jgi:ubiquinone biosynthesis protein
VLSAIIHFFRLSRVAFVFAREGVFRSVDPALLPASASMGLRLLRLIERRDVDARAARLSAALEKLGPSYVKLGQFLATRPDVVGPELARDLELLQDRMPSFGMDAAKETILRALGRPVEDIFVEFGPPIAAASIAQVHKAVIRDHDGSEHPVAVKVLRPGVARRFRRDLESFYAVAYWLERVSRPARRLRPVAVVQTLAHSVTFEMDLRLEASALSEMHENTEADPGFRVPAVDWDRTAKEVLTLEWVDGIPLGDHEALRAAGHDLPAIGRLLIQSFLRHAMRDGFFHADLHQGNLFVDAAGNIVAIDFGITGRLGAKERRFLAEILYGFIRRDYHRVAEVHFAAGYVPAGESVDEFARALRSIGEPIHSRSADQISMARLLTQLFEVTEIFQMRTQPELIMLQKTMVVVEGVARTLDPHLDMWRTADPVVREWIERNLGPRGMADDALHNLQRLGRSIVELPDLVTRMNILAAKVDDMAENGVSLSPDTITGIGRAEARRALVGHLALWTLVALVAITMVFG